MPIYFSIVKLLKLLQLIILKLSHTAPNNYNKRPEKKQHYNFEALNAHCALENAYDAKKLAAAKCVLIVMRR